MAKRQFKAESKRLLDLMINSIYTNKEIFLRELISNASDAMDKLYYKSLTDNITGLSRSDFAIEISADKDARTLTITDNGIGMTKDELADNLGTIAKSGSGLFKEGADDEKAAEDIDIIGQFGVGFYSAFMVSQKVEVLSKAFGEDQAWLWTSTGADGYTIKEAERDGHGTTIIMTMKEDTDDERYSRYLEEYEIKHLVKRYSDYIRYPIRMACSEAKLKEGTEDEYEKVKEVKVLNTMSPIWKKQKSEVTDEEYANFYKDTFYDANDPLLTIRSATEGAATYTALLFVPAKAPMNFYSKDYEVGLKLYASGVMIMENCKELLPEWFRFVRGLVDSEDLSLNISREMLQQDRQLKVIEKRLEKKIHDELKTMLRKDREKYEQFWEAFGIQIKYGTYAEYGMHGRELSDLVLFRSSFEDGKYTTLDDYVSRMKEDQKYIYYACGETPEKIAQLPQTELVADKGYEILYLTEDVDEFCVRTLFVYDEKEFRSVSDDDLGLETEEDKEALEKTAEENKNLFEAMKEALDGKVTAVKASNRLKSHPVCLSAE
ncbi:MAG: molecular chaperone HtpG, partial [Clostridia bacterium]|nr:molecular chaperone HtpG [Clostridia bacterium]